MESNQPKENKTQDEEILRLVKDQDSDQLQTANYFNAGRLLVKDDFSD